MIIGREVEAAAGRIDLLGITGDGGLRLIELKRDRTPREVIAQVLDYASWVSKLTTPEVHRIAEDYGAQRKLSRFAERSFDAFDRPPTRSTELQPRHGRGCRLPRSLVPPASSST